MYRALITVLVVGCTDESGPHLSSVSPVAAGVGAQITITGERLCGAGGDCATAAGEVQLGIDPPTVKATVIEYTDSSAVIEIPDIVGVGPTSIVLTVNERVSNALAFEVLP